MNKLTPDEVILGLLKAKPSHGYELLEKFKSPDHLGRIWKMSTSQLYAVLKRLEYIGAIIGNPVETKIGPERIEFLITEIGDEKINKWLYNPLPSPSIHKIRVLFISRVYIANLLRYSTEPIVAAQLSSCIRQRETINRNRNENVSAVEKITNDYIINQLDAAIAWLEQGVYSFTLKIA